MVKLDLLKTLICSSLLISSLNIANAQFVEGDVFLQGKSVEIGVGPVGAYGSKNKVPTGYHSKTGTTTLVGSVRLGFVADPALDGWTTGTPNFMGDYFVPGSPHEGWDIVATMGTETHWNRAWGTTAGGAFTSSGAGSRLLLTGKNTDFYISGKDKIGVWEGTMGDLKIIQKTILDTTKTYFLIEVELENTGKEDIKDVYYDRTVDPDNEVAVTGSYTTLNKIVFQPSGEVSDTSVNKCLVRALGEKYPDMSYLGLASVDCRAKSYILSSGLSPSTRVDDIFNGKSTYKTSVGDSTKADIGIGLVFKIGDIKVGEVAKISYAYILSENDIDSAFKRLSSATFTVEDFNYAAKDTVYVCPGEKTPIRIDGASDWKFSDWFPNKGLAFPSGRENIATVDSTTNYSIIGKNLCGKSDTISITIVPLYFKNPGTDGVVELCASAKEINLFDYLNGTPEKGGVWTGVGVGADGSFSSLGFSEGVYEYVYTHTNGKCSQSATVRVVITNKVDLDFDAELIKGCNGDTVKFINKSEGLAKFKWNFGDMSGYDSITYSPKHFYPKQDEYTVWLVGTNTDGCTDSIRSNVNTIHSVNAQFEMSRNIVCQQGDNAVGFTDLSTGEIASYHWDFGDGQSSNLQNPVQRFTKAGTYDITLTIKEVGAGCESTYTLPITVDSLPHLKVIFNKDEICVGESIDASIDYLYTANNVNWNFGDGVIVEKKVNTLTHTYTAPGMYYLNVSTDHVACDDVKNYDSVLVKAEPKLNLGIDTSICLGDSYLVIDASKNTDLPSDTRYKWNTGDTTSIIEIAAPGRYFVQATLNGCQSLDEIEVLKNCYLDIPNSFTPNDDGANDYFLPREMMSKGIIDFKMSIFNRWGEKIFETTQPNGAGWDGKFGGKIAPVGVYVYQIIVVYKNQASETYNGNVTLL